MNGGLNIGGWILLSASWGTILSLAAYLVRRTVRSRPHDLSAPLDLEMAIDEAADDAGGDGD